MIQFNKAVKNRLLITFFQVDGEGQAKAYNTALKAKLKEVYGTLNANSGYEQATSSKVYIEASDSNDKMIVFSYSEQTPNFLGAYNLTAKNDDQGEPINPIDYALQVAEEQGVVCSCSVLPAKNKLTYQVLCR